jgi:hypothetical protein
MSTIQLHQTTTSTTQRGTDEVPIHAMRARGDGGRTDGQPAISVAADRVHPG